MAYLASQDPYVKNGFDYITPVEATTPVGAPKKTVYYNPGVFGYSDVGNMALFGGTALGLGVATKHPVLGMIGAVPAAALGLYLYDSANKNAKQLVIARQEEVNNGPRY